MCNLSCDLQIFSAFLFLFYKLYCIFSHVALRRIRMSSSLSSQWSSFLKSNKQWRWQRAAGIRVWRRWGWWGGGGRGLQAFWREWKWNGNRNSGLCVNSVSSLAAVGQNILGSCSMSAEGSATIHRMWETRTCTKLPTTYLYWLWYLLMAVILDVREALPTFP